MRLLVADVEGHGRWTPVEVDQRVTRLGEGLAARGRLGDEAAARTAATVVDYARRARARGVERLAIVATSAVREAANGGEFAADLERVTGERVTVVSGEQEAALTLDGVLAGVGDGPGGDTLVFDIGGGSTEYILAHGAAVVAAISLKLGVVDLAERHPFPGPVEAPRFRALHGEIIARLTAGLPASIRGARLTRLVGSAGTATTLAALDLGLAEYDSGRVQGHTLTRGAVEMQLARLGALPVAGRAALPCLEPGRADVIVPGIAVVLATLDLVGVDRMVVSDWSLREGILISLVRETV